MMSLYTNRPRRWFEINGSIQYGFGRIHRQYELWKRSQLCRQTCTSNFFKWGLFLPWYCRLSSHYSCQDRIKLYRYFIKTAHKFLDVTKKARKASEKTSGRKQPRKKDVDPPSPKGNLPHPRLLPWIFPLLQESMNSLCRMTTWVYLKLNWILTPSILLINFHKITGVLNQKRILFLYQMRKKKKGICRI